MRKYSSIEVVHSILLVRHDLDTQTLAKRSKHPVCFLYHLELQVMKGRPGMEGLPVVLAPCNMALWTSFCLGQPATHLPNWQGAMRWKKSFTNHGSHHHSISMNHEYLWESRLGIKVQKLLRFCAKCGSSQNPRELGKVSAAHVDGL